MPEGAAIGITAVTKAGAEPYADAVRRSDGTPLVVLLDESMTPEKVLPKLGGLLLSGEEETGLDEDSRVTGRESLEHLLLTAALEADMPVLGVGRGMLALNLALGGTVTKGVAGHALSRQDNEEVSSYHRIYIAPGSKLAAIVGSGGFVRVNSRHLYGIKEGQKSTRLLASAYSLDDGVIEALESPDHDWVIGVQFHPERRMEVPPHFDRLFQGLIERAGGRADTNR